MMLTKNLSLCEKCLYMKLLTILFILEFEQRVEHVYFYLCQYINIIYQYNIISDKFKYFMIHQNCINNKSDAINIRCTKKF